MSDTIVKNQAPAVPGQRPQEAGALESDKGTTTIDDGVVAKIAGMAAREVPGVYEMGGGTARALGMVRGMVGADKSATQGVSVEVGERQAAVDLDLVIEYGAAIPEVAAGVRKQVISEIERMCGLEVTEVNLKINDVHLPEPDKPQESAQDAADQAPRVQ